MVKIRSMATAEEFLAFLQELFEEADLAKRFPDASKVIKMTQGELK